LQCSKKQYLANNGPDQAGLDGLGNPVVDMPSVARRAARQRQARRAVDSLVADASPRLARLMPDHHQQIADVIESSDSPESAAASVAALAASYDPGLAADAGTGDHQKGVAPAVGQACLVRH
jgi:hypothetical protein